MNGKVYWKQQLPLLFLHFLCMIALTLFLRVTGNSSDSIALILTVWIVVLVGYLRKSYCDRKSELDKLLAMAEQLEERYLIAEVMERPERTDDQVYYQILKMAGKSMLEQIGAVKREHTEYKDHIEQWVHEIKTPITAMKLLCENHRCEVGTAAPYWFSPAVSAEPPPEPDLHVSAYPAPSAITVTVLEQV